MFITFFAGGDKQIIERLTTLKPDDPIFLYFIALLLLHILVAWINKYWLKPTSQIDSLLSMFHEITEQVGFGIHGIYRAIAGATPVVVLLLLCVKGTKGAGLFIALSIILFVGSLFACCILSSLTEITRRRKSFL